MNNKIIKLSINDPLHKDHLFSRQWATFCKYSSEYQEKHLELKKNWPWFKIMLNVLRGDFYRLNKYKRD